MRKVTANSGDALIGAAGLDFADTLDIIDGKMTENRGYGTLIQICRGIVRLCLEF